ncbi:MAG TPA: flagellin [Stellaceae bacterium]|nr:flagellin [Stellaceae bacterium]
MVATLSTLGQNDLLRSEFTALQGQIQQVQNQVATGDKAQVFGDLGAQASLDINLRQQADVIDDFNNTISQLQVRTKLIESSLNIIHDSALNVQNLAFVSNQPSQRIEVVSSAQAAINQITQQLQAAADGRNLFGGTQTLGNPMIGLATLLPTVQTAINTALAGGPPNVPAAIQAAVAGVFSSAAAYYTGGPAYPPTQIDQGLTINDSITASDPAFLTILTGLYTLAALPQPVGPVAAPPNISDSQFDATAQAAASQISSGLSQLEGLVEKNGDNEKMLSDETNTHNATLTILQTQIDNIELVSLPDASTRLTQLQTQLQASYHIVASLQGLSLVNFLPPPSVA